MNTIIEQIRAEVERLKKEIYPVRVGEQRVNRGPTSMESAALGALNTLMSRISTLQEQPVCEGFDGEFSKFSNDVDAEHPFPICVDEFKDFARHFYELGRQSKPKVSGDLEEAAKAYADDTNPTDSFYDAFKEGAIWQKEQLMDEWLKDRDGCFWDGVEEGKKAMEKEAVEGKIYGDIKDQEDEPYEIWAESYSLPKDKFHLHENVKLVIIKED